MRSKVRTQLSHGLESMDGIRSLGIWNEVGSRSNGGGGFVLVL
jgi:hypothetical protein